MKPSDLADKLEERDVFALDLSVAAKTAFLCNLFSQMDIEVDISPEKAGSVGRTSLEILLRKLRELDFDVSETVIRDAHCAMIFPWSRSMISNYLGHDKVTVLGVPQEYGLS